MGTSEAIAEAFKKWRAGDLTDAQYAAVVKGESKITTAVSAVAAAAAADAGKTGKITFARLENREWGICWENCPSRGRATGVVVAAVRKDGRDQEVTLGEYVKELQTKDGRLLYFYRIAK
jgi:hypothetical protein